MCDCRFAIADCFIHFNFHCKRALPMRVVPTPSLGETKATSKYENSVTKENKQQSIECFIHFIDGIVVSVICCNAFLTPSLIDSLIRQPFLSQSNEVCLA